MITVNKSAIVYFSMLKHRKILQNTLFILLYDCFVRKSSLLLSRGFFRVYAIVSQIWLIGMQSEIPGIWVRRVRSHLLPTQSALSFCIESATRSRVTLSCTTSQTYPLTDPTSRHEHMLVLFCMLYFCFLNFESYCDILFFVQVLQSVF